MTQAHLQVGHTHEDVGWNLLLQTKMCSVQYTYLIFAGVDIPADAALAVVTSALNGTSDIQTPQDLQRLGARMFVVVGMAHLVLASPFSL